MPMKVVSELKNVLDDVMAPKSTAMAAAIVVIRKYPQCVNYHEHQSNR
jgi:hypothetical protein